VPLTSPPLRRGLLALVAAAAVLVWVGTVANTALDPDESQHLHAAWLVGQGQAPFAEFWEHHSPLLYYLLAPLTRGLADSPAVYFGGRALMALTAAAALCLVYRLAVRLSPGAALAAVALLAFLPRFVQHATEVRPDVPALVAGLAALLLLVRWRETGGAGRLWAAGLALGVAVAFTPKAAYGAPGMAAVVVLAEWRGGPGALGRVLAGWARLGTGAALPVLALLGGLFLHGGWPALDGFAEDVLARSLAFADFTRQGPVTGEGVGFLALALAGLALTVSRQPRRVWGHALHGTLLPPLAATVAVLLLPATPAVYRHAWLPVLALVAVYAGCALAAAFARSRALAAVAVLVGLVGPATVSLQTALVDGNSAQLAVMRRQLARACPGEPVLDGTALYVFRPAAYRYHVLMRGIRKWIAEGAIPEERIVEDVRRARPRVAYADSRLRALVGPMADFLAQHYVPLPDGLLAAGAAVRPPPPRDGGRAEVELLLGETYRLATSPDVAEGEIAIDRQPVRPGLVRLEAGRHELSWRGPVGLIQLTTLDCAERRALSR
jgi:4-amino-4-deoxy-L-arabinose transferase-like glycosyltransferase